MLGSYPADVMRVDLATGRRELFKKIGPPDTAGMAVYPSGIHSRRAKKYDETNSIWQARVNRSWRFYFVIRADEYVILSIIPHPK